MNQEPFQSQAKNLDFIIYDLEFFRRKLILFLNCDCGMN